MTPEEIVEQLSRMSDPRRTSDPDDAVQTLTRLIRESRAALSSRRLRREARMYLRETRAFADVMIRIQEAPADELRSLAMFVTDLLWGEGEVTAARGVRRLDFDKEWDCPRFLGEIAEAVSHRSFYPFPKAEP